MLRARAGTAESVTKTSTFSIPHHAAPVAESRTASALLKKRNEATAEDKSRTPGKRERKSITSATNVPAKKDQAEENILKDEQSPAKIQVVKDKAESTRPYIKKLQFNTIGNSGTDET